MSYNKQYYDDRKTDLRDDYAKLQLDGYAQFMNLAASLQKKDFELQKKYKELEAREQAAVLAEKQENEKKIEKKEENKK